MRNFLLIVLLLFSAFCFAAVETIPKGSYIVNLGISPQTKQNALQPYGLVYDLLQNLNVPVKWAITPSKTKDGTDFTYKNTPYKSGAFIILEQYRTAEVNNALNAWVAKGVVGQNTEEAITVEIYATLTYAPKWTIDKSTGNLVTPFFENAGIPASAHGGPTQASWKTPDALTECDDIFILPHADPRWNTHNKLLSWNKNYKGAIWSGCHAVSVMENIVSPDGTESMNFLTKTGMVNYSSHSTGIPPYTYYYPSEPVMQFVDKLDAAATNGSESVYLPKPGGGWRPGVKLSVTNPTHAQIPSLSPGPAAVLAYGFAFDDPSRGLVMYQGGHFHNGGSGGGINGVAFNSDHVALQRAFFNFSLMAVVDRQTKNVTPQIAAANVMAPGSSYQVSFSVPAGINLSDYQVRWTASSGTVVLNADNRSITYSPSFDESIRIALLTVVLKDACGREFFTTMNVKVSTGDENVVSARLVSANGDGKGNEFLYIKNIGLYPNNDIQIFNRWGIKVYEIKGYDNATRSFRGAGNANSAPEELISGVYYYILRYKDDITGKDAVLKDYFILKR